MKIWGTRSDLPLSVGIRWALGEDCSHVVFVFDDKLAVHSNLEGVNLAWASTIKKHNTIVYELDFPMTLEQEEKIYKSIMDNFDDVGYDFKGFVYFAYRAFLKKFFKIPIPAKNALNSRGMLCTELAEKIDWASISPKLGFINQIKMSMVSPSKLINLIVQYK